MRSADLTELEANALLRAARDAAANAYAPYSGFQVGAAALLVSGEIVVAANVENAVYGLGICAEVNALGSVASQGALADLRALAIVGYPAADLARSKPTPPCGRCRQVIAEAATVAGRDVVVLFGDAALTAKTRRISELLPDAFSAETFQI